MSLKVKHNNKSILKILSEPQRKLERPATSRELFLTIMVMMIKMADINCICYMPSSVHFIFAITL